METEAINRALFRKLEAEFDSYRTHLLQKTNEEILEYAYEYSLRQDILGALENNNLTFDQAQRLLDCPDLLDKLVDRWENSGFASLYDELIAIIEEAGEEAD